MYNFEKWKYRLWRRNRGELNFNLWYLEIKFYYWIINLYIFIIFNNDNDDNIFYVWFNFYRNGGKGIYYYVYLINKVIEFILFVL